MAYDPIHTVYGILRRQKEPISVKTEGNFYVTGYIKALKKVGGDLKVIIRDALITKNPLKSSEDYARELERRRTVNVYVSLFRDTQHLRMLA
jgi:hypothetical protein